MRGVLLASLLLFAASFAWGKGAPEGQKIPILIEAKRLISDNKAGWVDFLGDVVATRGDMKITCSEMKVFFKNKKLYRIEAYGNVRVVMKNRLVKAERAIYYAQQDKIVFEGNPEVWKGKNVVRGDRIVYFIKDDRSIVETEKGDRVKAVISPEEVKEGAGGK